MDHRFDPSIPADSGQMESRPAQDATTAADRARFYWIWAVCGLLALLVGLVFGQKHSHQFTGFDDDGFIYNNPHVRAGLTLPGVWWALTDGPYGEWCPLATLSDMLDCQFYGVQPAGHFFTALLLHGASSVLLFLVLLRMTGQRAVPEVAQVMPASGARSGTNERREGRASGPERDNQPASGARSSTNERREGRASGPERDNAVRVAPAGPSATTLWPSAWVAAVFAIHPLHVESVAWAAERRDVLSGLFFMLTLGAYVLYAERPSLARYLAVAVLLALGLMAKPMLVTLPFVLVLLDYWPLARLRRASVRRLLIEKLPLVALALASCAITLAMHTAIRSSNPIERLPLTIRLANALVALAAYLGQTFWPVDLAPFYPHLGNRLPLAWAGGSLALLVAITVLVVGYGKTRPYLSVGWFWFLGMLVPVLGLVGAPALARADRYTYLSQIGLSLALAWSVWEGYRSRQLRRPAGWRTWTLASVSAASVLALAAVAWRQVGYWQNAETLWTRALACTKENVVARYSLGYFYAVQGKIDEAIDQCRQAVLAPSINPVTIAKAHGLLADCLLIKGKTDEALEQFQQAVQTLPDSPVFHARFAAALAGGGKLQAAIDQWRQAIRLSPSYSPSSQLTLAKALLANGENDQAADACREILRHDGNATEAMLILGEALNSAGKADQAAGVLERVLGLEPENALAHLKLGLALSALGRPFRAIDQVNEALRLQPTSPAVLWQAAWILATSSDEAIRDGKRAVRLAKSAIERSGGQEPHAFDALAAALAEKGEFVAALESARRAAWLAAALRDEALADAINARIRLYRQNTPYRQEPRPVEE